MLQDWCDKDKFIRQRWTTICTERGLAAERPGESKLENLPGNSLTSVLSAVFDEFVHGQDRYISRLVEWDISMPYKHSPLKMDHAGGEVGCASFLVVSSKV